MREKYNTLTKVLSEMQIIEHRLGSPRVPSVCSKPPMNGDFYRRWEALGIEENKYLTC